MKIAIIGTGNMGASLAKATSQAGHHVSLSGRNQEKAQTLANQFSGVTVQPAAQAAQHADIIIIATGYNEAAAALRSLGDVTGKTIIDITNPLSADYMSLTIGHTTSAAEENAKLVPTAHLIKAFNTLFAQVIADGPLFAEGQIAQAFFAGDDDAAKAQVKALITSLGFKPVDAGKLVNARYLEAVAGLNIYFGYGAGLGTAVAPSWISK